MQDQPSLIYTLSTDAHYNLQLETGDAAQEKVANDG
jgi:hypothetical protein